MIGYSGLTGCETEGGGTLVGRFTGEGNSSSDAKFGGWMILVVVWGEGVIFYSCSVGICVVYFYDGGGGVVAEG